MKVRFICSGGTVLAGDNELHWGIAQGPWVCPSGQMAVGWTVKYGIHYYIRVYKHIYININTHFGKCGQNMQMHTT